MAAPNETKTMTDFIRKHNEKECTAFLQCARTMSGDRNLHLQLLSELCDRKAQHTEAAERVAETAQEEAQLLEALLKCQQKRQEQEKDENDAFKRFDELRKSYETAYSPEKDPEWIKGIDEQNELRLKLAERKKKVAELRVQLMKH
jgi:hypothetical protein